MSLFRTGLSAFKWSVVGELGSRVAGPLAFLVIAWTLTPADFGVAAAATIFISFSQVVWDNGLSRTLVQQRERVDDAADIVFWLNLACSLTLALAFFVAADAIAGFFTDPRVAPAIRVLVLQLPLSAITSVQVALLQRDFGFRRLTLSRLLSSLAAPACSVLLVLMGAGFWALVVGALAGQLVQTAVIWSGSNWRPRALFDKALAGEVWRFGRWSLLSGFLAWAFGWVDSLIIGRFLGPEGLGVFRSGNTLAAMLFGVLFAPLLPVAYSLFSRIADDIPRLRDALLFMAKAAAIVALPVAAWLFVSSAALAGLLFPPGWAGIGEVLAWMALVHGVSWLVGYNGEVYRAIGRPALESIVSATMLGVYVLGLSWAAQFGLLVFLQARLGIAMLSLGLHVVLAARVVKALPAEWLGVVGRPALMAAAGAAVVAWALGRWGFGLMVLVGASAAAGLVYVLMVAWTEQAYVRRWRGLLAGART